MMHQGGVVKVKGSLREMTIFLHFNFIQKYRIEK
jgi:hypothetical protein